MNNKPFNVSEADSKYDRLRKEEIARKYGMRGLEVYGLPNPNEGFKTVTQIEEENIKKKQEGFKVASSSVTYQNAPLRLSFEIKL